MKLGPYPAPYPAAYPVPYRPLRPRGRPHIRPLSAPAAPIRAPLKADSDIRMFDRIHILPTFANTEYIYIYICKFPIERALWCTPELLYT